MSGLGESLALRMMRSGESTLAFFRDLPAADWKRVIYSGDSSWTVRDVLAHFVSAEAGKLGLVQDVLAGGPGAPEDFDLDGFNAREIDSLAGTPPAELLDSFAHLRQSFVRLVAGMSDADLACIGRDPYLGLAPLADMIRLVYFHNQIHIREIRRCMDTENGRLEGA